VPAVGHAALLADAGLVHEPQLDPPYLGMPVRHLPDRAGMFIEPLLRSHIGLGVDGPGLLPPEVEPLQHPPDPALAVAHPEAALDQGARRSRTRQATQPSRSSFGPRRIRALSAARPAPVEGARHRGHERVDWQFTLAAAAYNLIRVPKLRAMAHL
jgi:hypothetical protein